MSKRYEVTVMVEDLQTGIKGGLRVFQTDDESLAHHVKQNLVVEANTFKRRRTFWHEYAARGAYKISIEEDIPNGR